MSSQSTSKIDLDYKYNNYNNNINQTIHNHYYIPSQILSVNHKIRKKKGNACYCLNCLEQYGKINIIIKKDFSKIFISKLQLIDFNDNFDLLFEKGKNNFSKDEKKNENLSSIPDITFWYQRYYYYSKFDEGIKMDNESWYSVTPEIIAEYTAKLANKNSIIIEGFCGSGGNVIQFSKYCKKVYAIDIDEKKLDICKNNCKIYNCPDNIIFIHSDFLKIDKYKENIKGDYIFLSPPWGGIQYKNNEIYCIKNLMKPDISEIIKMSLKVSKYIMFYLPRTLMLEELFEIISEINHEDRLFFDVHILKSANKIKALLIIFGYDINKIINKKDIEDYINHFYSIYNFDENIIKILIAIAGIIGNFRFFKAEIEFRRDLIKNEMKNFREKKENVGKEIICFFYYNIMNEHEKIKLKSYNYFNSKSFNIHNYNNNKKTSNNQNEDDKINIKIQNHDKNNNNNNNNYNNENNNKKNINNNNNNNNNHENNNNNENNNNENTNQNNFLESETLYISSNNRTNNNNNINSQSGSNMSTISSISSVTPIKHSWILEQINEINFEFLSIDF